MVVEEKRYKVIGTRPLRPDGIDKVTGRAQYGADVRFPGLLYGRVKRSPYAHAIIKHIDTSRAESLPGVKAVITHADFPVDSHDLTMAMEGMTNLRFAQEVFFANRKALFVGHPVAAVVATDPHIAEDAIALIDVEYEELTPVLDVREAMVEGSPILHDHLRTRDALAQEPSDKPTNIAMHMRLRNGDVEAAFAEADVIVEREYTTTMFHQGYIEPQNATAFWSHDNKLQIWASTQAPWGCRALLSRVLQLPVSDITWMPTEIGGGFGGKLVMYLEPLAALLSRKTGRPVKMTMTREDVFMATGPTSGTYVRVKLGAKKDGRIIAGEAWMAFEAGAFPGSPVGGGVNGIFAPYQIPNILVDGYDIVVNKSKTAAYRAPGTPAGMFAGESTLNELAAALDIDPIELRMMNASKEGDPRPFGGSWPAIGNYAVMEAMKNTPHYRSELTGPYRGRGVALGYWGNAGGETSSSANVTADGAVQLVVGSVDIGGSRASLAMQLAETLGIDASDVKPKVVDSHSVGFTGPTAGSRTTFAGGWAAYELGLEIRRQMSARAAKLWEVDEHDVTYHDDGVIRGPRDEAGKERSFTFKELASKLPSTGGTIDTGVNVNRSTAGPGFGGHIVDLEVDPDTGKVKILRYTAVQDVGVAIHPSYVEGQIQGGVAQGLGMALTEEYVFSDNGRMLNASFLDYRMLTAYDLPMIDTEIVEVPNPGHPYGVRGVGEVPIVPPLGAVQAAIAEATGHRFTSLPMSSKVILNALLDDRAE